MGNISSHPQRLGAGLVAADSVALALLDPDGLTIGSRCWNADVEAYFALTVSTAGLSADIVEVFGLTGTRWIKAAAEPGTVASVVAETSNAVDNSDATNPIILDATALNAGTMSAANFTKLDGLTNVAIKTKIIAGADSSLGPVQTAFTGAVIGDKVVAVIDLDNLADVSADFETTISVTDKIVQTVASDLSAITHILVQLLGSA
jgi:hypothetical protein